MRLKPAPAGRLHPAGYEDKMTSRTIASHLREILGCPLYLARDDGQILNAQTGRVLRQRAHPQGYRSVDLHTGKRFGLSTSVRRRTHLVHILICTAFHGEPPTSRHEVAHWNGQRSDNCPENLRWATRSENHRDKRRHGTNNHGRMNGRATLSEEQAMAILADQRPQRLVAAEYGIRQQQVSRIRNGKRWSYLQERS